MGIEYGCEKLMRAVHGMAASPASIQQRIADAYTNQILSLNPEADLPPDSRGLFEEIKTRLTAREAVGGEGRVRATVNEMSNEEAADIALTILRLYDEVCAARVD